MKKILSLVLGMTFALGMVAMAQDSGTQGSTDTTKTTKKTKKKKHKGDDKMQGDTTTAPKQ